MSTPTCTFTLSIESGESGAVTSQPTCQQDWCCQKQQLLWAQKFEPYRPWGGLRQKQAPLMSQDPSCKSGSPWRVHLWQPCDRGNITPAAERLSMLGNTRPHGTGFVNMWKPLFIWRWTWGPWENGKISSSPLNSQNTTINTLGAYLRQKCVWVKDNVVCGSERSTRIGSHLYVCSPRSDTFPENLHSLKTQGDVIKPGRMPSGGVNPALILHLEDKGWDSHFTTIHKLLSLWCAHG